MTGFICLDKPQDITSFLAVNKLRRLLGEKKVGHTGTLDPMATGVLLVALGGATRFIELIPNHDKSYFAEVKLGLMTDTLDVTGNVLKEEKTNLTKKQLEEVIKKFTGRIKQVPPMFSAIKKDGVRLYDLARKGIEVEREEREVEIEKIEIVDFDESNQEFSIKVDCSEGTYIRTLAEDIGKELGTFATLKKLVRTKANGFENPYSFDEIKNIVEQNRLNEIILPVDKVLELYPKVNVSPAQSIRFSNGGELSLERLRGNFEDGYYRIYSPDEKFLGIGQADNDSGEMKVKRVYNER